MFFPLTEAEQQFWSSDNPKINPHTTFPFYIILKSYTKLFYNHSSA